MIDVDMIEAVEVVFKKPIFEEDFVERGMSGWLTGIEWDDRHGCYELYFYFGEHFDQNLKYFREVYHPNKYTTSIQANTGRSLFTAIEANMYTPYLKINYSVEGDVRDDKKLARELMRYLLIRKPVVT